jgi:UDP-N-acetylglucosamine pyrophosphorylase
MKLLKQLFDKINAIENLVKVTDLKIEGNLPNHGCEVTVECTRFKFSSGSLDMPVNFTVLVRVDGVVASRWDMCYTEQMKEFQLNWVKLINELNAEEFERDTRKKEIANDIWMSF